MKRIYKSDHKGQNLDKDSETGIKKYQQSSGESAQENTEENMEVLLN